MMRNEKTIKQLQEEEKNGIIMQINELFRVVSIFELIHFAHSKYKKGRDSV